MKKLLASLLALMMILSAFSALAADYSDVFTNFDLRDTWTEATLITFNADGVLINGSGASADGTVVYITQAGTFNLTGACENGQIVVELNKDEKAQLVLNGLTLTCADSAALYVISADKVALTLAPDTVNALTDAAAYTAEFEKQPGACVYSKDDLVINGTGTLVVNGNNSNGIGCKNDLRIVSGTITVNAVKNALKGNDSVAIKDGVITLTAGNDAIKADTEDKAGKGYIYIEGGTLDITAGDDAIQGQTDVTIKGGTISVSAEGKTVNSKGTQDVASGIISAK